MGIPVNLDRLRKAFETIRDKYRLPADSPFTLELVLRATRRCNNSRECGIRFRSANRAAAHVECGPNAPTDLKAIIRQAVAEYGREMQRAGAKGSNPPPGGFKKAGGDTVIDYFYDHRGQMSFLTERR